MQTEKCQTLADLEPVFDAMLEQEISDNQGAFPRAWADVRSLAFFVVSTECACERVVQVCYGLVSV